MTEFQPRVVIRPIPRLFTALSILRNQRTNPSISSTLKHVVSCFMNWYAYQFEPKGIGSYSTNKTFWACIEGLADAVRAQAGYFDMSTRKPGGNWMDGYRTTGFFIQWLTTKDPDAIRKFHETVRDLDEWSFDKAMKRMFGDDASIEGLWNEYQAFLSK